MARSAGTVGPGERVVYRDVHGGTALNISANQAGYLGKLPASFALTGHSAGGGLATIAAGDYLADIGANSANNHLLGVVMFDGVAADPSAFAGSIASLQAMHIPDYVVAAPPQLVTQFSPPGNTQAVYTLSSGWINDIYTGAGPTDPIHGVYGPTGGYLRPGGQQIILGRASGIVLPESTGAEANWPPCRARSRALSVGSPRLRGALTDTRLERGPRGCDSCTPPTGSWA